MGRKRKNKISTSSTTCSDSSIIQEPKLQQRSSEINDMDLKAVLDKLELLTEQTNSGFKQVHEDFDSFRHEIKSEISAIKTVIRDLEKAMNYTESEVEDLKKRNDEERTGREELSQKLENLEREMINLRKELQQEKEERINLEQYTRRENLIFNRIPESQSENCKKTVKEIINDMGINADEIRFHAIDRKSVV